MYSSWRLAPTMYYYVLLVIFCWHTGATLTFVSASDLIGLIYMQWLWWSESFCTCQLSDMGTKAALINDYERNGASLKFKENCMYNIEVDIGLAAEHIQCCYLSGIHIYLHTTSAIIHWSMYKCICTMAHIHYSK